MTTSISNTGFVSSSSANSQWMNGGLERIFSPNDSCGYLQTRNEKKPRFLEIHPDGFVRGGTARGIFGFVCVFAHINSTIVINGSVTNMYLCMDKNSHLYSSKTYDDRHCAFKETMVQNYKRYHHHILGENERRRKKRIYYVGLSDVHAYPGKWTYPSQNLIDFTESNLKKHKMDRLRESKEWKDIQVLSKTATKEEWVRTMELISNKTYEFQMNEKGRYLEIIGRRGIVRGSKRKRSKGILEVFKTPWGTVVFKSYISCQYLCMNSSTSRLYGSESFDKKECQFHEDFNFWNTRNKTYYRISYTDLTNKKIDKWYIGIQGLGVVQLGNKSRPSQKGTQFIAINATRNMLHHQKDKKCVGFVSKNRIEIIHANPTLTSEQKRTRRRKHKKNRRNYRKKRKQLGITTDSAPGTKKDKSSRLYKKWCRKARRRFFNQTTISTIRRYKERCRHRTEPTANLTA
ncbi:hypothetical protein ScPMuIL_010835 [Solemya velum]